MRRNDISNILNQGDLSLLTHTGRAWPVSEPPLGELRGADWTGKSPELILLPFPGLTPQTGFKGLTALAWPSDAECFPAARACVQRA